MSFPYRRWYAELSRGELREVLDVGLTGAPDYVRAQHPNFYAARNFTFTSLKNNSTLVFEE